MPVKINDMSRFFNGLLYLQAACPGSYPTGLPLGSGQEGQPDTAEVRRHGRRVEPNPEPGTHLRLGRELADVGALCGARRKRWPQY